MIALYRADQALYPRARVRSGIRSATEKTSRHSRSSTPKNAPPKNAALFVGSSTIAKWKTADAFPGFSVINRGFGGSVLGDVQYFYKDVIGKYHPSAVLLYCDNDVTGGGNPDQAFEKVMQIYAQVRSDFPQCHSYSLSMKHAPNAPRSRTRRSLLALTGSMTLPKAVSRKDPGSQIL